MFPLESERFRMEYSLDGLHLTESFEGCRLQAYLDSACRKADTAQELWIQRRTLYGRLARIEQLLKCSLNDQDTRTRLTLALQGLGLLRQRQSAVPFD